MSELIDHPYAELLHRVQKPARYLGGETGEIRKDWHQAQGRMCLAFPDIYDVGMSHLGFKILYSLLNRHPKLLAERAYAPWTDMEQQLREHGQPLRSLESWRPLHDFDVVGFSLQFELTFTNILLMLELGGIPLRSAQRDETHPLVVAGGPTATHAEAIAPFIDAFVIGDGEEKTPELLLTWTALRDAGMPRAERLEQLAALGGIYVPSLYETREDPQTGLHYVAAPAQQGAPFPVERAFLSDISRYRFPTDGPVATAETVFDRMSVEIARGCTEGCRFCQAGMIYRPVRERDPEEIISVIRTSVREKGYDEASLTSLSTADYSAIAPLIRTISDELSQERVSVSVSSLRAYGLEEAVLDDLQRVRAGGLTFAPEAGTQRMRDVVNKNVTEEQLLETAHRVFSRDWAGMKLYFMIGLPTEEDEDVRGIVQTGARALQVGRKLRRKPPKVTVSVSTHVPKPHTPFQWCAMDSRDEVLRKQALLRDEARRSKVQLRMHDSEGSWLEGVLARGDRRIADVVETAYRNGARFDSWEEQLRLDAWRHAFDAHGIEPGDFLGTLPTSAHLPWEHIDVGLEDGFLEREYRKALKNRLSPPCGKAAGDFVHHTNLRDARSDRRRLVCYDCGIACDMTSMRERRETFLTKLGAEAPRAHAETPPQPPAAEPARPRPPRRAPQGPAQRVRLGFAKLGRAAFHSHLDLVRLMPRLMRRVGLPLYYSEGFQPKPQLSFGPALSLGISSLAEYVDVKLRSDEHVDVDALAETLSAVAVDGLHFFGARRLGPHDASITRVIDEAVYVAALPRVALTHAGLSSLDALHHKIAERRRGPLKVRREIKGIGKQVDVGRYLVDVRVNEGRDVLARAGLVGDLIPITLRLRITGGGTAKVSEALDALLACRDVPARFVRAELLGHRAGQTAHPLQLDTSRARASDEGGAAHALAVQAPHAPDVP